jgi:hypothetical protein
MKDNYLWDRSGEPDAEVQELEELLGSLRYKPKPLEIPAHIRPGRRQSLLPAMAMAAAIALFAVLMGVWFSFNRRQSPALTATNNSRIDQPSQAPAPESPHRQTVKVQDEPQPGVVTKHAQAIARTRYRASRTVIRQPELTPDELAEKEQVLVALRLVSVKLNVAQRKTQAGPQLNPIRNQHRIG